MVNLILVTGGAGNVGSALKQPQTQVVVADNLSDDTVDSCIAVHRTGAHENDVVNVGSDVEMSIRRLAETVIRVLKSPSKLKFLPPLAEGDMTRRCPDTTKMKALLNRPQVSLEDGIRRLPHTRLSRKRPTSWCASGPEDARP